MADSPVHVQASQPPAVAPVARAERISSVDMLRGFSLLGILLMNIVSFGLPGAAYMDPTVAGGFTGANRAVWLVNQVLFEGKMRTIFSMLFGAGVVILTSRAEARGGEGGIADVYYRRTLWLIVFGLLHAYFLWVGDILYMYGLVGLMLYPFRRLSGKAVLVAGLATLAVLAPKYYFEGKEIASLRVKGEEAEAAAVAGKILTEEQQEARKAWAEKKKELKPGPSELAKEINDHRAGYLTLFKRRAKQVIGWQTVFFYRFSFFDVAGMMLVGMGLMKLGVFSAACSFRFYVAMAALGYSIGAPLNWHVGMRNLAAGFDPAGLWMNFSAYDLGRLSVALGHIGVVMLVAKAGVFRWLTSRLAAVGQMALSNYLAHSLICTTIFYGHGFGLFGRLERFELLYVVVPIWVVQLLLSPIWLRYFRFGPMEWAWRSMTYGERQPMRLALAPSTARVSL